MRKLKTKHLVQPVAMQLVSTDKVPDNGAKNMLRNSKRTVYAK